MYSQKLRRGTTDYTKKRLQYYDAKIKKGEFLSCETT